ncbi:HWE histidine kinase domain-containing protein [Pararhizobium sp. PWRC1-1]|uniref:HWE histidine kinase domain-containing protein n=1 Tax=Pararhizobium sp. PWRC1-1 TaxID=2804566 RepID=UPI003CECF835
MLKIDKKSKEQIVAEGEVEGFREELGPFVVAAETTRMAMVFTNAKQPDNPIIFANDSFLALTGYAREEVLGQSFNALIGPASAPDGLAQLKSAFADNNEDNLECICNRKDGSVFWAAILIGPVRDDEGDIVQHFISFTDLTKHKDELAKSRMFIDELNHRVKNTLSTVQSIVSQALRTTTDPVAIREAIESRIFALSRSHDLLSREIWKGAELHDLLAAALEPFKETPGKSPRFVVTGGKIRLSPKVTLALGMAFHELATNAVKYGALSYDAGSVSVDWTTEVTRTGKQLTIHWQEKNGPIVATPSQKGFGSKLLERGLAHELEGTVDLQYRQDGIVCTFTFSTPEDDRNG